MNISKINQMSFGGLLQVGDRFFNTDKIVYTACSPEGVFVALEHSERPHAKPNDYYEHYYGKICSSKYEYFNFPKEVNIESALKAYSNAAKSKDAIVTYNSKKNSFEYMV